MKPLVKARTAMDAERFDRLEAFSFSEAGFVQCDEKRQM